MKTFFIFTLIGTVLVLSTALNLIEAYKQQEALEAFNLQQKFTQKRVMIDMVECLRSEILSVETLTGLKSSTWCDGSCHTPDYILRDLGYAGYGRLSSAYDNLKYAFMRTAAIRCAYKDFKFISAAPQDKLSVSIKYRDKYQKDAQSDFDVTWSRYEGVFDKIRFAKTLTELDRIKVIPPVTRDTSTTSVKVFSTQSGTTP